MDLSTFGFALRAVTDSLLLQLSSLFQYQLFWGFVSGFVVATLLYAFLISNPSPAKSSLRRKKKNPA